MGEAWDVETGCGLRTVPGRIFRPRTASASAAERRLGCGVVKSCEGVWPKLAICDSTALRSSGSVSACRSTMPSYVM